MPNPDPPWPWPDRSSEALPTEVDFDPFGGDLDAQRAWKNFGGLTLEEAHALFLTNPLYYQEDFMFMGPRAFVDYFPVIDRYVREVTGVEEGDDCEVAILGSATASQLDDVGGPAWHGVEASARELSAYVLSHLHQYSPAPKDQRRIARAWQLVEQRLSGR